MSCLRSDKRRRRAHPIQHTIKPRLYEIDAHRARAVSDVDACVFGCVCVIAMPDRTSQSLITPATQKYSVTNDTDTHTHTHQIRPNHHKNLVVIGIIGKHNTLLAQPSNGTCSQLCWNDLRMWNTRAQRQQRGGSCALFATAI